MRWSNPDPLTAVTWYNDHRYIYSRGVGEQGQPPRKKKKEEERIRKIRVLIYFPARYPASAQVAMLRNVTQKVVDQFFLEALLSSSA